MFNFIMVLINIELKCSNCGKTKNLELHEIHLKRHPTSAMYFLLHPNDFTPLCRSCHRRKHRESLVNGLKKINGIKREGKNSRFL
jgi:5-methylcytosine-specific restriction endonuclease McrA